MSAPAAILQTKLYRPSPRPFLVTRSRLLERLDRGLEPGHRLTLISAPAGYGKTTLVADWLASRPCLACWLSLDVADNEPSRFLCYVITALQQVVPSIAAGLVRPLRSTEPPTPEAVVTALVNELASVGDHVTLVLDDYHVITSPAVSRAVTFLLENLPPNIHLVIGTRSDPPVPVARLRSRGQAVEIRADDLRFTPDEAAAFLTETMGLRLSAEQVAALDERTEGWIAGLQMAALSMRGRDDVEGFIRAFAGTNRFILDFMLEEVLSREPEEVQSFLLRTSILSRLAGPLCDAVTGSSGGQEMLERLERDNLFVVSLDDDRRWYRYHNLFADLLKARLRQSSSASIPQLLSRAAEWCEANGYVAEAVGYALAARDFERATALVERYWERTTSQGEIETVWSWLNALPVDTVRNSASLSLVSCWVLWLRAQIGLIEPHLQDAERAASELDLAPHGGADDATDAGLPAQIAALRSIVARYRGDFETAIALAERALTLIPGNAPPRAIAPLRSMISLALASAHDGAGDIEKAVAGYTETISWSRFAASATGLAIVNRLIALLRTLGRLRAANEACRDVLGYVHEHGMDRLPAAGILHLTMSELLAEQDDLEAAETELSLGFELGKWSGRLDPAKNAAYPLMRLRLARDDLSGALAAVEEAEAALSEPRSPLASAELLALKARVLARQGDFTAAGQCVKEATDLAGGDRGQTGQMVGLAESRVCLARCTPEEAVARLTQSLGAAERSGRLGAALELRILRSIALLRQGDAREAEADLERALTFAEPEGYVRIFIEEGEPVAGLLRRLATRPARTSERAGYSSRYLAALLAAFRAPDERRASTGSSGPGVVAWPAAANSGGQDARSGAEPGLIEPLSERECEVLKLLAEGLTNEQIAGRLIIALGTAKAHIHNISGKLGAQNRAHAVARARELGLL